MSRLQLRQVHSKYLSGLSHEFSAGPHWVLCSDTSTATDLTLLCAGMTRAKRGQVLLDDAPVSALRYPDFGVLPAMVTFPQLRVERLVTLALQLKDSTQTAQQLLNDWDLGDLAPQLAGALDLTSARRIALLLALATPSPKLLALHDVFGLGLSRERLLTRLAACTEQGAVVLLTADRREIDGIDVANSGLANASVWVLQPSRLIPPDQLAKPQHDRTVNTLFILCSDARALSEQLSRDPRISSLRLDERTSAPLVEVTGTSEDDLANAVADAALQCNIDIRHMTPSLSPLLDLTPIQPQPLISSPQPSKPELPDNGAQSS